MIETLKYGQEPRPGLLLPPWYPKRKFPKHHPGRKQEGMLWVPQKGALQVQHNTGAVGATTVGAAVTTGAAASTKGTPVELITSTAFDTYWVIVIASAYGAAGAESRGCLDLLIGLVTEDVLIANMLMGGCGTFDTLVKGPKQWQFPLYIPAGSRIAAQVAGARTATAMRVAIYLYGGNGMPPFRPGGNVTTYGIGTVPDGTAIVPGASAAEGAWAQITAGSTADHFAFIPSFQVGNDASQNLRNYAVDMGIGAATEEEIGQSYWFSTDSSEHMQGPFPSMPVFADVPAATRLVMRASNSGANDGAYSGAIHGVS